MARQVAALSIVALLCVIAGCAKSPQDKAREAQETIESWQTALHVVDSANARHSLPKHWVRDLHESATQEIAKAKRQASQ